jgi:hypothetical protein
MVRRHPHRLQSGKPLEPVATGSPLPRYATALAFAEAKGFDCACGAPSLREGRRSFWTPSTLVDSVHNESNRLSPALQEARYLR